MDEDFISISLFNGDEQLFSEYEWFCCITVLFTGQDLGQRAALTRFVQAALAPPVVANANNSASVALALRVLASLVSVQTDFSTMEDSKVDVAMC